MVELMNISVDTVEIGKNVKLGKWEPLESCEDSVFVGLVTTGRLGASGESEANGEASREKSGDRIERKIGHLGSTERDVLMPVIMEYMDLFQYERSGLLPCTSQGYHEIKTGDALPIKKTPYKVPFALRDEMRKQLDEMLQRGVITPAFSEWTTPVILIRKKSPDNKPRFRFCTDFRGLNAVTKIPVYPIPDIKGNLSLMAASRYFTLLDIESAYWHIPIHPDDKDKTEFITPSGTFRYERLAYGLAGAPQYLSENYGCHTNGLDRYLCPCLFG
jgi:hypothetical protein